MPARYTGFDYLVRVAMGVADDRRSQQRRAEAAAAEEQSRHARRSTQRSK